LSNSLTRSEKTASGYSDRTRDGARSGKFFHSPKSLRRKRVLASESSHVRATIANNMSRFFFAIVICLSRRRATLMHAIE
jgi:hypothetical protein